MALKPLLILGTGGTAMDLRDFVEDLNRLSPTYDCLGFLDDNPATHGKTFDGLPVLGAIAAAHDFPEARLVSGVGGPGNFHRRDAYFETWGLSDARFETLIHPLARVSTRSRLGAGCVVYPFVFLGANVEVGRQVVMLSHCAVNHDVRIGDFSMLASGVALAGGATVARRCYVGSGSSVMQGVTIGEGSLVGMGSVVLHDVPENRTVVGSPARVLRPVVEEKREQP